MPRRIRTKLGVRDGAGARETRRERLCLEELVGDVEHAGLDLAGLEVARKTRVVDGADEAVGREEAVDRATIAHRFTAQDLQRVGRLRLAVLTNRLIDDAEVALADLLLDREVAELTARRELLFPEQPDDVANARVDFLARVQDDVDERVDPIAVEATLGQRKGVAPLRGVATHLVWLEPEKALAHLRHLLEREEALELTAHNVDRRIDLLLFLVGERHVRGVAAGKDRCRCGRADGVKAAGA